jgi:hypothetical protein
MTRLLLLATTTGYQTRSFGEAAEQLGVELVFATDRCHLIEDPWQDHAIPIRFHDEDASVAAILDSAGLRPLDGLLVVGDRPTVIAARVAERLGLPWHPAEGAAAARHKERTRERLRDAGMPVPWWFSVGLHDQPSTPQASGARLMDPSAIGHEPSAISRQPLMYPCVVKPVSLSGSRGVMRADDRAAFGAVFERLRALMRSAEVRAERNEAHDTVLVEGFIPGREYAVEALLHRGVLRVLAIFDKPDPLDGPFFEETIYVTPSSASAPLQALIVEAVTRAALALGLYHGPVHAECRVNDRGVFVLEVAARPIGGLCARALRFSPAPSPESSPESLIPLTPEPKPLIPLEELLLRHALGEDPAMWRRERGASGVMMIPIPRRGIYRGVDGIEAARQAPGVDDVRITAKADQLLVPLPEGASYLGFIFARGVDSSEVDRALRDAHARLVFTIDPELPVLSPGQVHYNRLHG